MGEANTDTTETEARKLTNRAIAFLDPTYSALREELAEAAVRETAMRLSLELSEADLTERIEFANNAAHVIVEAGVVPGFSYPCRCGECRAVAVAMDEAGYLDRVKDRWWDAKAGGGGDG